MKSHDRAIEFLRKHPDSTQKEISEGTGMHLSAVTRTMKFLYETHKVLVNARPGMSMRYSLNQDKVLRSPKGIPLSELVTDNPPKYVDIVRTFATSAVTKVMSSDAPSQLTNVQEDIRAIVLPGMAQLSALWEILLNASYEEVEATRNSAKKEK